MPESGLMPKTQIAMWRMLSCCCRIGEVIQARWEHVDFEKMEWVIPKEHSKNRKAHMIYLSEFALNQFIALKQQATSKVWCFPDTTGKTFVCTKSTSKQIRDRQLAGLGRKPMSNRTKSSDALLLTGGDWVPHDLRRTPVFDSYARKWLI
jgi:integrase